jgi:hypothetical protein
MGNFKIHTDKGEHNRKPEVTITSFQAVVQCKSNKECQFSIADESGRVLKKGFINGDNSVISFDGINPGFYHLIVFNEFDRFRFPIKID